MKRINNKSRKVIAALLLAVLVMSAVFPAAAATARGRRTAGSSPADTVNSRDFRKSELSPFAEDGSMTLTRSVPHTEDDDFSFMRVLINVGSVSTISFKLRGSYYIDQNYAAVYGTDASPAVVTVTASGGRVTAAWNGATLYSGTQLDIMRTDLASAAGYAELVTAGYADNNGRKYLGDLRLSANTNGTVRFVNVVPTAHYLYGIIPYEMSESCDIEALKAQAVTAKTYAFGFTYSGTDYDITDSFTYQGYRGYNEGYPKCMAACLAVTGKLLFYNGDVPLAFYGSTNGGETALPSHAFGTSPLDGAYQIRLDNIDVQYGSSKVKTFEINYGQTVTNAAFRRLLEDQAASALGHSVTLVSVTSANVNTPKFSGCQRNMTKMDVTMKVLDGEEETTVSCRFDVTKLKTYGVFSGALKIYWGKNITNGYKVYFARYGHGLGLSQYGADGFAHEGSNYIQILNFYFGNMQLTDVKEDHPEQPLVYSRGPVAYGSTNSGGVRLRGGAGTDYPLFATLPANTHVDIISEADGWLICIANGILGYIRGDLVDINLFPSPGGAVQAIGRASFAPNVTHLDLRSGPSEYCEVLLGINNITILDIWNEIGGWYRVCYLSNFYYVEKAKVEVLLWTTIDLHSQLVTGIGGSIRP
ncbi:MAG: SpoIID/LytB domain-containing protein [Clostridia bacterium]|nr:SpoIID/LytB domain-containing protein [Clostridia bacterium]